jgi:arsenite methyltransferase
MVSDIVLLKELPDSVKNSIEAYVGCLSGALMKELYIGCIREAGFQDIKIVDETFFPIEFMANDPTGGVVIEKQELPLEELNEVAGSVISIKVHAVKPNGTA